MDKETPIPNDRFRDGMNSLANGWFRKWRDHFPMTDDDWESCIQELTDVHKQYPYQLIREIGTALVAELERRDKQNAVR